MFNRQTELWSEIQGKVTTLADAELEQKFEVSATLSKLQEDEKALQKKSLIMVSKNNTFSVMPLTFPTPFMLNKTLPLLKNNSPNNNLNK